MTDEMEIKTPENEMVKPDEEDLYHKPSRLIRISLWANTLSWIFLVITVVLFGLYVYSLYMSKPAGMQLFASITNMLFTVLPGLFFFIALQAISEGIYILLDIMDGVRTGGSKA